MQLFGQKNIAKTIVFTTIVIILSNSLLISFFYLQNTYNEYELQLERIKVQQINLQKTMIKQQINDIVQTIDYCYTNASSEKKVMQDIIHWLNSLQYDPQKSDYIFVYEIKNLNGGDDFATLLINPNRPDLIGKGISDDYTDPKGKKFRKEFLRGIRKDGESFVRYAYNKPSSNEIVDKISYFKYYKNLNWVVAKGVYVDDINDLTQDLETQYFHIIKKQIIGNIVSFVFISLLAVFFAYIFGKKIESKLREKDNEVEKKTQELEQLNISLQDQIQKEVKKASDQEKILMQKSKFIAMGEMISNIAHQWRQPISELSTIFMNIKLRYDLGKLEQEFMDKKAKDAEQLLEYMSTTIDDFRSFFKPNKQKEIFNVQNVFDAVMHIIGPTLQNNNIQLQINIPQNIKISGYANELEQALLNIISNAKDALIDNEIKDPNIIIQVVQSNQTVYLSIEDNAGGIQTQPIDTIFEPYFTTKMEHGTGIGLYMTKMIVEKNLSGKLNVENTNHGARFVIELQSTI